MKLKNLINEVDEIKNPLSKGNKKKLRDTLSQMFDVIEKFEKNGKIDGKSDKDKIDVLKNVISDMVKQSDREKIIKGDG
ncbi:hypothetical protein CPG37_10835 [Malaciobacter canalis]|uniref:Uncharacterized protein n=1 Tax=Malaciobacter canalis TaxID=1912871 RepID=A0ABX4LNE6_9BACT|nr:hypothetical protein [Malaciobacter canalis]PHO09085.1 hypothetical protein CPG37_10835 [Malaciobacter canalis]QEE31811.1 hypothetical protein ACAN_0300 [Malaciobacter canalis]